MGLQNVTWNPNDKGTGVTLSNGNLTTSVNNTNWIRSTHGKSKGKWYWEVKNNGNGLPLIGILSGDIVQAVVNVNSNTNTRAYYSNNGYKFPENISYGAIYAVNDIISILMDLDNGTLEFWKNGVSQGVSHINLSSISKPVYAFVSGGNTAYTTLTANFGATPFTYNVPSGYTSYAFEVVNKILISSNGSYKKWNTNWQDVALITPTEQDFITNGMDKAFIGTIPEAEWRKLDGQIIKLVEYTDNPSQVESKVETEVEPYSIYDEFGDTMEVLYYTDDATKTKADLEITANYSPLDELEGDFEVVTWSNAIDEVEGKMLNVKAIPIPQFVHLTKPAGIYGSLSDLMISEGINNNVKNNTRYLISPNKTSWYTWDGSNFVVIDISTKKNISTKGMTYQTILNMKESNWISWSHDNLYVGVYLDDDIREKNKSIVDSISYVDLAPKYTTKISDAKLYILNTISTINVTFTGKTITGEIDDADSGKVQYRVLLNGVPYLPQSGEFTPLQAAPLNVALTLSNNEIKIDENNVLRIEFQDYWGATDYWETNFIGTYSGLMYLDSTGEYYSTDVGEILQYLDFGIIIAGQTTIEQAIVLRNTYGYPVNNILIRANQSNFPTGMTARFGTNEISFESLDELLYAQTLNDGEELTFYIRLATQLGVTPPTSGEFDIIVTADKVI